MKMDELKNITIEEAAKLLKYTFNGENYEIAIDDIEYTIEFLKKQINEEIYTIKDLIDDQYMKQHKRADSDDKYKNIIDDTYDIDFYCSDIAEKRKMLITLIKIYDEMKGDN